MAHKIVISRRVKNRENFGFVVIQILFRFE